MSAASDLGLTVCLGPKNECMPGSQKRDAMLIWVNRNCSLTDSLKQSLVYPYHWVISLATKGSPFRNLFENRMPIINALRLTINDTGLIEPRHEKTCFCICEQQRRRSACASAQSDQRLCCSLPG